VAILVALTLWLARPAALAPLYRGVREGRASGALLFSIVQAVGAQTTAAQHAPASCL